MSESLSILILEKRPADTELIRGELRALDPEVDPHLAPGPKEFAAGLASGPDLVLVCRDGADSDWRALLREARKTGASCVIIAGQTDDRLTAEAIREGADDVISIGQIARLRPFAARVLEIKSLRESRESKGKKSGAAGGTVGAVEQLRRRADAFAALDRRLADASTASNAAGMVLDTAHELLNWDSASFNLYSPELDELSCILDRKTEGGQPREARDAKNGLPASLLRRAIADGPLLIANDEASGASHLNGNGNGHGSLNGNGAGQPPGSIIIVPINHRDRVTGVMALRGPARAEYSDEDLDTLRRLAEHSAGGLEFAQAREKYRSLFEHGGSGINRLGAEGRFLTANPALARMLGFKSVIDLITSIDDIRSQLFANPERYEEFGRVMNQQGLARNFEAEFLVRGGGKIWVSITACAVMGDDGAVLFHETTIEDISDRKRNETFLRSIVENLPIMVFIKDAVNLRFVMWNRHNEELCGMPSEEMIGKTDYDVFSREHADRYVANDREALNGKRLVEVIEEMETRHKGVRILRTRKYPILDEHGQPLYLLGISEDITERKQAEAELDAERDLLRSLMDHSSDQIYFKDLASRFIRASKAQWERFGVTAEGIIGRTDFDFFEEDHARPAFEDEQEIIRTGLPIVKVEREVWKLNQETTWVLTNKMPLRSTTGEIIGTFGISKDITDIKHAEAKLEEVHKQLLETSRMAGMAEVATSVLHNVGNVLNSVNISCSVITDRVRNSKVGNLARATGLIESNLANLGAFITEDPKGRQLPGYLGNLAAHLVAEQKEILQELSSLSGNVDHIKEIVAMQQSYAKVSGVQETLAVVDLVEDALRMNAGAMERHRIEVVRDYASFPPVLVEKHKILQILVNMIRNAKYALDEKGHADKRMTLRVELTGGNRVGITVSDNGVGISPENLTRIFAHGFTTRKEGHGFGLHSGALAAREMGGSLKAHSDGPGLGAAFTLEFPARFSGKNQ